MSNTSFRDCMVFRGEKHFDSTGYRKYSEIHWSDFWWEMQVKIFCPNYSQVHETKVLVLILFVNCRTNFLLEQQ